MSKESAVLGNSRMNHPESAGVMERKPNAGWLLASQMPPALSIQQSTLKSPGGRSSGSESPLRLSAVWR
eukprot:2657523-Alexandrium_andersonii.AAC.1